MCFTPSPSVTENALRERATVFPCCLCQWAMPSAILPNGSSPTRCHLIRPKTHSSHSALFTSPVEPQKPWKSFSRPFMWGRGIPSVFLDTLPWGPFSVSFSGLPGPGKEQAPISHSHMPWHQQPLSTSLLPSPHLAPHETNANTQNGLCRFISTQHLARGEKPSPVTPRGSCPGVHRSWGFEVGRKRRDRNTVTFGQMVSNSQL